MQVYIAGSLADVSQVRAAQAEVEAAGHSVTLDWTRGSDAALTDYASAPSVAATIAEQDLRAVLEADAVLVLLGEAPGLGMFVELGAALASAAEKGHGHVAVVGRDTTASVFYFHPAVRRCESVADWLRSL